MWKPCCDVDGGTTCFSTTPDSPSWRSIPSRRSRIAPGGRGDCTSPTWVCEACRAAGSRILQSLSPPKQVDQRQHSLKLMPDQQSVVKVLEAPAKLSAFLQYSRRRIGLRVQGKSYSSGSGPRCAVRVQPDCGQQNVAVRVLVSKLSGK